MEIRNFKSYLKEYEEFYQGILELARMENNFYGKEVSLESAKKYNKLYEEIISQCSKGTNIEDLIGLVVVSEFK